MSKVEKKRNLHITLRKNKQKKSTHDNGEKKNLHMKRVKKKYKKYATLFSFNFFLVCLLVSQISINLVKIGNI